MLRSELTDARFQVQAVSVKVAGIRLRGRHRDGCQFERLPMGHERMFERLDLLRQLAQLALTGEHAVFPYCRPTGYRPARARDLSRKRDGAPAAW